MTLNARGQREWALQGNSVREGGYHRKSSSGPQRRIRRWTLLQKRDGGVRELRGVGRLGEKQKRPDHQASLQ